MKRFNRAANHHDLLLIVKYDRETKTTWKRSSQRRSHHQLKSVVRPCFLRIHRQWWQQIFVNFQPRWFQQKALLFPKWFILDVKLASGSSFHGHCRNYRHGKNHGPGRPGQNALPRTFLTGRFSQRPFHTEAEPMGHLWGQKNFTRGFPGGHCGAVIGAFQKLAPKKLVTLLLSTEVFK